MNEPETLRTLIDAGLIFMPSTVTDRALVNAQSKREKLTVSDIDSLIRQLNR